MTIDYQVLKNWSFPEVEHTYTVEDTMRYALAVGVGHDRMDERALRFVTEYQLQALPTMVVVLGYPGFWTAALRGIDRLIDRGNDLRHRNAAGGPREAIAAARAAHAGHQLRAPQLAEQLLEIGQRYALPLADRGKRHWAARLAHGQIHHCRYREPAFSRESHGCAIPYPLELLKYIKSRANPSGINNVNNHLLDCS